MKSKQVLFKVFAALAVAALVFNALPAFPAAAATQVIGGTAVNGNLRVTVQDNGAMEIAQYNGSTWVQNIYGTSAKGSTLCVGTTRYDMGGNSTWTPGAGGTAATWVSNTGGAVGSGTITTTWTAGGMNIVQTTSYTDGNQYYTISWAITNTTGGAIADVRLFNGQDTLLAGSDSGNGWWNAGLGAFGSIGVTHPTNGQQMWLQTVSEAAFNHESRVYYTSRTNVNACALDGTVTATTHDNGYALEFRNATLAAGATWTVTLEEHFTQASPPATVTNVSPNSGPTTGGQTVTITGTNFTGFTAVTFGGTAATCPGPNNATTLICTTPAHAAGLVSVAVTVPGGTGTMSNAYTFVPPPVIASISPAHGPETGGTVVAILGTNLAGSTFTFGGIPATCLEIVAGTSYTCASPAHAAGPVNVVATNTYGTHTHVGVFTYDPAAIPNTGFAPNRVTALPEQTVSYAHSDLWLEIPKLGIQMDIVGVPAANGEWDVTWLGTQAGWLEGSAFPTWAGNSVITGHVWNADNSSGPFRYINTLWYGDQVIVHAWDADYVYEVRAVQQVSPGNTAALLKHEELPWVTLVTCRGYDEATGAYKYRVLVRAVLVEVK